MDLVERCKVIRFLLSVGPVSLISLRRKLSPDAIKKKLINATMPVCPANVTNPSVPSHKWSLMSNLAFSICTRCTPRAAVATPVDSWAACSSSAAAFCTVISVLLDWRGRA